jgi:hypothetical protein
MNPFFFLSSVYIETEYEKKNVRFFFYDYYFRLVLRLLIPNLHRFVQYVLTHTCFYLKKKNNENFDAL